MMFLIALVAACGGGSGSGDDVAGGGDGNGNGGGNPPPVEGPPVPLTVEHLESSRAYAVTPPSPRLVIVRSPGELNVLSSPQNGYGWPRLSASDFDEHWLLYLEYRPVRVLVNDARIGIERIETSGDGSSHLIFAEACLLPPDPRLADLPDLGGSRPYSLYRSSRFTGTVEVHWTERNAADCLIRHARTVAGLTPDPLPLALVVEGDAEGRVLLDRPTVVRSSEQWAAVRARIGGPVPAAYENPDFTRVNLIYVETDGDWGVDSYVRIWDVHGNADRSYRLIRTEYCGLGESLPTHRPFAIYETEVLLGTVEFDNLSSMMGRCLTQR